MQDINETLKRISKITKKQYPSILLGVTTVEEANIIILEAQCDLAEALLNSLTVQ